MGLDRLTENRAYPSNKKEENLTGSLIYYIQSNLLRMEQAAEYMDGAYNACSQYLAHPDTASREELLSQLEGNRRLLYGMEPEAVSMTEELRTGLEESPFSLADSQALHDYLEEFRQSCISNIYFMEYITDPDTYLEQQVRENVLECYEEILEEELQIIACGINDLLLPIEKEESLEAFKYDFLPQLYYIPLEASTWSDSREALASGEESSWNAIERSMDQVRVQIGEENMKLMETKAQMVQELMESGLSQQEAEERMNELSGQSSQLTQEKDALQEAQAQLEEKLNEAREKFAPQESDDMEMLWGKMLRFLNLGLYDEALNCLDFYREKARGQDAYAELYVPAARRFIESVGQTGIDYGLMVVGYEPGQDSHEQYEIGDVIIALNGLPVHNYEEYSQAKESLPSGTDYRVIVLRQKPEDGNNLTETELSIPGDGPRVQIREMTEKTY